MDRDRWGEMKESFAELFLTRTRDEWSDLFEGSEACATPVLGLGEAPEHPHNAARGSFVEVGGGLQPAPAPGSAAPRRRPRPRRPSPAPTPTRRSLRGGSRPARSRSCVRPARSGRYRYSRPIPTEELT